MSRMRSASSGKRGNRFYGYAYSPRVTSSSSSGHVGVDSESAPREHQGRKRDYLSSFDERMFSASSGKHQFSRAGGNDRLSRYTSGSESDSETDRHGRRKSRSRMSSERSGKRGNGYVKPRTDEDSSDDGRNPNYRERHKFRNKESNSDRNRVRKVMLERSLERGTKRQGGSQTSASDSNSDLDQRCVHRMASKHSGKGGSTISKRMRSRRSGKCGFGYYGAANSSKDRKDDPCNFTTDRKLVMKMLKRENQLRFSQETQRLYDKGDGLPGYVSVPPSSIEDNIQMQVLREHNIEPTPANIHQYRCLNYLYRNDKEVCLQS